MNLGKGGRQVRDSMAERVRVVVIGGGVVGCSCLYHLARLGWSDLVLLERNELTSGSTWHAAGNCPTFATSWGVLRLQQYSAALYRQLAADAEHPITYHVTGSVRLAHTRERMDEYRHVLGMAHANDLQYEILDRDALCERYPLAEVDDLSGALWDPCDGDIDPAQLTQGFAAAARRYGARVRRFTSVTALAQQPTGEWRLSTDHGDDYLADIVVNAAGYRAGEVMALLGRHLPIVTMSHQYLVTDDVAELLQRPQRVPLLRDPDVSYYLRQERSGFILGPYEHRATPRWLEGIPQDFAYKLFPDDLGALETYIAAACRRVPALAAAGIKRVVNGPIPYSPDGLPYIGPAPGLENFFHCNTFSFGIAQAGGAGKALAEWVVQGGPQWDLWCVDPRRFGSYATRSYALAKAVEIYQNEYAPAFPYEERPAGRPLLTSPLHDRLEQAGARFGVRGGWERALWYQRGGRPEAARLSFRREQEWLAAVGDEVRSVRSTVGIMDLPGLAKFLIEGPGAAAYLDRLVCSRLPAQGRIALAYSLDDRGHIRSEFTLTRLGPEQFYAVSAASAQDHDADLFARTLAQDGAVAVRCVSQTLGTLVVAGPRARDLLSRVTRADLVSQEFPWLSAQTIELGDASVWALRIGYVGELGWEIHAPTRWLPGIYELLRAAGDELGLRHFGMYAMDSLRIDKCYRGWKSDLTSDTSPLAAGLGRFVDLGKGEFVGRAALAREAAAGPAQKLVPLMLQEGAAAEALSGSSVFLGCDRVGIVTSGTWSFTLDTSVALAYVRCDLGSVGTCLAVDVLGDRLTARVVQEPPYDPGNLRLRA